MKKTIIKITESDLHNIVAESVRTILREGSRDRQLDVYMPYFEKAGINVSISQLKQMLLAKFVNEAGMNNLSLRSNYYLAGVAKYYFNGDLTENKNLGIFDQSVKDVFKEDVCDRLNALIMVLRNAYIDSVGTKFEQPEDFGELSLNRLLRKYNKKINIELGIVGKEENAEEKKKKDAVSNDYTANNGYTYDILYSYAGATKYNKFTTPGAWCITYGEQHFNGYQKRYNAHFVIFRKNDFESIPREKGENWTYEKPQDEYGNSLIAVLQSNSDPYSLPLITSRWNHGVGSEGTSCEADHAYSTQEFLNLIGDDGTVLKRCFEQWKRQARMMSGKVDRIPNSVVHKALRKVKYAQMLLNSGARYEDINENEVNLTKLGESNIYSCAVYSETEIFYTIACGRKIYFEDFFSPFMFVDVNKLSEKVFAVHSSQYKYYFDQVHKKFIEVEGIKRFKHGVITDGLYLTVAVGQYQKALINFKTMKPFSYNGNIWFEDIYNIDRYYQSHQANRTELPKEHNTNNEYLRLVYDSSAGIEYLYSVMMNKIVPIEIGRDEKISTVGIPDINNKMKFIQIRDYGPGRILDIQEMKFIRAENGADKFKLERLGESGIVVFKYRSDEDAYGRVSFGLLYFDMAINDFIKWNGKTLIQELPQNKTWFGYEALRHCEDFIAIKYFSRSNDWLLYDSKLHKFYSDEFVGDKFHRIDRFFPHAYDESEKAHTKLQYWVDDSHGAAMERHLIVTQSPGKTYKMEDWERKFGRW